MDRFVRDRGSIPLALLLAIIVAGLAAVITARVIAESRATGTDREFTAALHAADAGLNDALYRLNNRMVFDGDTGTGDTGDGEFEWEAIEDPDDPGTWVVTSTGVDGDVERTVVATLEPDPMFEVAAFAEVEISFVGANGADSYNSGSGEPENWSERDSNNGNHPDDLITTGAGIIGSNGEITLQGNAHADGVVLYDFDPETDDVDDRCDAQSPYCDDWLRTEPDRLDFSVEAEWVEERVTECDEFADWQASDHFDPSLGAAVLDPEDLEPHPGEAHGYCVGHMHFDEDTVLDPIVTVDEPLILFMDEGMELENHVKVNCVTCEDESVGGGLASYAEDPAGMPEARRLQVYTNATTSGGSDAVTLRNHAYLGGAVFAPNAECGSPAKNQGQGQGQGGGAGAQAEVYGSLICETLRNVGGWEFHYDEDLREVNIHGMFNVSRWTER